MGAGPRKIKLFSLQSHPHTSQPHLQVGEGPCDGVIKAHKQPEGSEELSRSFLVGEHIHVPGGDCSPIPRGQRPLCSGPFLTTPCVSLHMFVCILYHKLESLASQASVQATVSPSCNPISLLTVLPASSLASLKSHHHIAHVMIFSKASWIPMHALPRNLSQREATTPTFWFLIPF